MRIASVATTVTRPAAPGPLVSVMMSLPPRSVTVSPRTSTTPPRPALPVPAPARMSRCSRDTVGAATTTDRETNGDLVAGHRRKAAVALRASRKEYVADGLPPHVEHHALLYTFSGAVSLGRVLATSLVVTV